MEAEELIPFSKIVGSKVELFFIAKLTSWLYENILKDVELGGDAGWVQIYVNGKSFNDLVPIYWDGSYVLNFFTENYSSYCFGYAAVELQEFVDGDSITGQVTIGGKVSPVFVISSCFR